MNTIYIIDTNISTKGFYYTPLISTYDRPYFIMLNTIRITNDSHSYHHNIIQR